MNRNKATHSGTCQWCGRVQKLPEGVLAKHGYTTKWGFFSGVCRGAEEEPFELSCDLVKKSIVWAQAEKQGYINECAKLRASTSTKVPIYWYRPYNGGRHGKDYGSRWIEAEIVTEPREHDGFKWNKFFFDNPDGKREEIPSYSVGTTEEMIAKLNDDRAKAHEKTIRDIDNYIAYQTERVKNWKPALLKEVKE